LGLEENIMVIVDFRREHIEKAINLLKDNYNEEKNAVKCLPEPDTFPDLSEFAENELGTACFENNEMLGFLCCYSPWENQFGTTYTKGTFSPIHGHGAVRDKRKLIYSGLYQAAAEKWVNKGILSHAVGLYAHDKEGLESFFNNGFGLRCIDAVRDMEHIPAKHISGVEYSELEKPEFINILPLQNLLTEHMGNSPCFMHYPPENGTEFINRLSDDIRFFTAKKDGKIIAYIKVGNKGENFICLNKKMINICGAFCLPEYRGTGVYSSLLSVMTERLKQEGYIRTGVDFESFNPAARGFWLKYFTAYTNSVVRRIDERIYEKRNTEIL
jgi:GNAT superfamily N-acetyltransferase